MWLCVNPTAMSEQELKEKQSEITCLQPLNVVQLVLTAMCSSCGKGNTGFMTPALFIGGVPVYRTSRTFGKTPYLGPPVVLFLTPFLGEGSPTKIDYTKRVGNQLRIRSPSSALLFPFLGEGSPTTIDKIEKNGYPKP